MDSDIHPYRILPSWILTMRLFSLVPAIVLSLAVYGTTWAVDAVSIDASGNTTFTGTVAATGQVTAPNVLQGSAGVNVTAAVTLTATAFGTWHWIAGTTVDYAITLPTAAANAGKTIGLRVKDATLATKTYTLAASSGQTIDGATTIPLSANATLVVMSDGTGWARVSGTPTSAIPSGSILALGSGTIPAGWLECNGQTVSRTTYAALFATIGTTWGAGDGSTTFNVPSLSRRTLVGRGGTGTGVLANSVGAYGGEEAHIQTVAEMPAHSHGISYKYGYGDMNMLGSGYPGGSNQATTTGDTGGGTAFNVMQPSAVALYMIKY